MGPEGHRLHEGSTGKNRHVGNFDDDTPFAAHNAAGLLSMANNGPNMNGSQFVFALATVPHFEFEWETCHPWESCYGDGTCLGDGETSDG